MTRSIIPLFLNSSNATYVDSIGTNCTWLLASGGIDLTKAVKPKLALHSCQMPYTWVNVPEGSVFLFQNISSSVVYAISFAKGIYSLDSINNTMQEGLLTAFPSVAPPNLDYDVSTSLVRINFPPQTIGTDRVRWVAGGSAGGYTDFFGPFLGFSIANYNQLSTSVTYTATDDARINDGITSLLVTCNLTENSVLDANTTSSVIYKIMPQNVSPLDIISEVPNNLLYLDVQPNRISTVNIRLMKSDGISQMDILGEPFSCVLVLEYE